MYIIIENGQRIGFTETKKDAKRIINKRKSLGESILNFREYNDDDYFLILDDSRIYIHPFDLAMTDEEYHNFMFALDQYKDKFNNIINNFIGSIYSLTNISIKDIKAIRLLLRDSLIILDIINKDENEYEITEDISRVCGMLYNYLKKEKML